MGFSGEKVGSDLLKCDSVKFRIWWFMNKAWRYFGITPLKSDSVQGVPPHSLFHHPHVPHHQHQLVTLPTLSAEEGEGHLERADEGGDDGVQHGTDPVPLSLPRCLA